MSQSDFGVQTFGLDEAQLRTIIDATASHKAGMDRLNVEVLALGDLINQYMGSVAGQAMHQRIIEWGQDFNALCGQLDALNVRVTDVRQALIDSHHGATSAATR